jgi:hypothetical protein
MNGLFLGVAVAVAVLILWVALAYIGNRRDNPDVKK